MTLREIFNKTKELMDTVGRIEAKRFLEDNGFWFIGSGVASYAFGCDLWGGVVVKISTWEVDSPDLERHPWLRQFWLKPLFHSQKVMVQPRVERFDRDTNLEISKRIREKLREFSKNTFDSHDENVGIWRGRDVCFDFLSNGVLDSYKRPDTFAICKSKALTIARVPQASITIAATVSRSSASERSLKESSRRVSSANSVTVSRRRRLTITY